MGILASCFLAPILLGLGLIFTWQLIDMWQDNAPLIEKIAATLAFAPFALLAFVLTFVVIFNPPWI